MKRTFTWIRILGLRILKNPFFIVLLLIIPALSFAITMLPSELTTSSYNVGIYLEGEDELATKLTEQLLSEQHTYHFVRYDDLEQMTTEVANNKLACAYLFPKNLSELATSNSLMESITVFTPPASILGTSINELVYADLLKIQGEQYVTDYIKSTNLFNMEDSTTLTNLLEYYHHYTDGSNTFMVLFETYRNGELTIIGNSANASDPEALENSETASTSALTLAFPLRGSLAVLIFLSGLVGGITFLSDGEKGVFAAFFKRDILLARIIYILVPTLLFSFCTYITLGITGELTRAGVEIGALCLYNLVILGFTYVLTLLMKTSKNLICLLPILMLGSLIISPVFLNLENYLPFMSILNKLFAPSFYLMFFM